MNPWEKLHTICGSDIAASWLVSHAACVHTCNGPITCKLADWPCIHPPPFCRVFLPLHLAPLPFHPFSLLPSPPPRSPLTTSPRYPPTRSDDAPSACMPSHTMSEDTKSSTHRSRRVLVLANPDPGDSSGSDDDRRGPYPPLPQPSHTSSNQHPLSMIPPSPYRAPNKPTNPTVTTNLPASSHSNPTSSSPSSQSSNAVESTPPPSTPGQAVPPDIGHILYNHDDGSAVNDRSDLPQPSRIQKVTDKLWKPRRGSRPKESEISLHVRITFFCGTPANNCIQSPTPSCHLRSPERIIMVTYDCHAFTTVNVTPANSVAFVWERIFTEVVSFPFVHDSH